MATSPHIIEPGSLDIDLLSATNLRIGEVETTPGTLLGQTKDACKFVVVEHFMSPDGKPLEEEFFDPRRMCFSLFAYDFHKDLGMHYHVVEKLKERPTKTGAIVGGAEIERIGDSLEIIGASGQYCREPFCLRKKYGELLLEVLRLQHPGTFDHVHDAGYPGPDDAVDDPRLVSNLNPYWPRYRQVFALARTAMKNEQFDWMLKKYFKMQEKSE